MSSTRIQNQDGALMNEDSFYQMSEEQISEIMSYLVASIPNLIGAAIVLLLGWIIGRVTGSFVRRLVDRSGLDESLSTTPIAKMMGDSERAFSKASGKVTKWFIYLAAVLAATNILAIPLLSQWISVALTYIPVLVAGLLTILIGFIIADFIGDFISRTEAFTQTRFTELLADGVRIFLYFTVTVIGLDTMGLDVTLLYVFARALSWGLAAGIGLAIAIGFGWGSKDYIAENIGEWRQRAREESQ